MFNNKIELEKLKSSIVHYLSDDNYDLSILINNSVISAVLLGSEGWHNEIDVFQLVFSISIKLYKQNKALIDNFQDEILNIANIFIPDNIDEKLSYVVIRPLMKRYLNWKAIDKSKNEVLSLIETLKSIMISVATGNNHIQDVNDFYQQQYKECDLILNNLGVANPNNFLNLWDWYTEWKDKNLTTYASRRQYIAELYKDLIDSINEPSDNSVDIFEPTGWDRVDRAIYEMKSNLSNAKNEEQFQAIAMIGRETLITIAQQVYNAKIHICEDGVVPSNTDSKRMLDAYIQYTLCGSSNERQRKFAKSAIDLANQVTHDRCAVKKDAELCYIAVLSVANVIKTLST